MFVFTNLLRRSALITLAVMALGWDQSASAQGCHGGGMGSSRGGMGGYMGGGYSNGGYTGGGYSGGGGQSYGSTDGYRSQGSYSTASQNASSSAQTGTNVSTPSLKNPATALKYASDLNLTSKQVQALNKMAASGQQRAALVLTKAQRQQLVKLVKS